MELIPSITIPGPFGTLHIPPLETPPFRLPAVPDSHGKQAIRHAVGQDIADVAGTVVGLLPPPFDFVGDFFRDAINDMHAKEIRNTLSTSEYGDYLEYSKLFPSSVAMARVMCFQEVKTPKAAVKQVSSFLPMSPKNGPPLPRLLNVKWPKATEV